ncbi:MAG TPA: hypothetical protein PKL92_07625 [Aquaticitalea sp.]|mgnify:CR=1 FL=1|nr:hypothetical protein [Aquaticitalea sp.]HNU58547.1 hypothetical protein [Aquaticitalea sp.]
MKDLEQMPLYNKALEIQKLVNSIIEITKASELKLKNEIEKAMLDEALDYLMGNSLLIPAKIAEAYADSMPYDIKMENAVLIRKAARELLTDARSVETFGFKDVDYMDVLRTEIDGFRLLFIAWVKTFDPWDYILDDWGLFNPPGIEGDANDGPTLGEDHDYFDDDDDDF